MSSSINWQTESQTALRSFSESFSGNSNISSSLSTTRLCSGSSMAKSSTECYSPLKRRSSFWIHSWQQASSRYLWSLGASRSSTWIRMGFTANGAVVSCPFCRSRTPPTKIPAVNAEGSEEVSTIAVTNSELVVGTTVCDAAESMRSAR